MKKNLSYLRILALLEGISYLLFTVTMPLKYMYAIALPNQIVGMAHGILFILYCSFVIIVKIEYKWNLITTFWALLASLVPFGTFIADFFIFRKS